MDIGDTRLREESGSWSGFGDGPAAQACGGGFKMIIVESMPLHGRGPKRRAHRKPVPKGAQTLKSGHTRPCPPPLTCSSSGRPIANHINFSSWPWGLSKNAPMGMDSVHANELQLMASGPLRPIRHAAARGNSNESGFVKILKKISREGGEPKNSITTFCHI